MIETIYTLTNRLHRHLQSIFIGDLIAIAKLRLPIKNSGMTKIIYKLTNPLHRHLRSLLIGDLIAIVIAKLRFPIKQFGNNRID